MLGFSASADGEDTPVSVNSAVRARRSQPLVPSVPDILRPASTRYRTSVQEGPKVHVVLDEADSAGDSRIHEAARNAAQRAKERQDQENHNDAIEDAGAGQADDDAAALNERLRAAKEEAQARTARRRRLPTKRGAALEDAIKDSDTDTADGEKRGGAVDDGGLEDRVLRGAFLPHTRSLGTPPLCSSVRKHPP